MVKYIYSVHDRRAKMFHDPFVAVTDEVAMRDFQSVCMDVNHPMHKFAEDYSLVRLASLNVGDGFVDQSEGLVTIAQASAFKRVEE